MVPVMTSDEFDHEEGPVVMGQLELSDVRLTARG
jgi:hypothetical protein